MKKKLIVLGLMFGPLLAFAQTCTGVPTGTVQGVVCAIGSVVSYVIPVLMSLAVLFFIYGVVMYVIGTDEEAKKSAKSKIIYGLIGLVVIVGVWGLVKILTTTLGVSTTSSFNTPVIPFTP